MFPVILMRAASFAEDFQMTFIPVAVFTPEATKLHPLHDFSRRKLACKSIIHS